MGLFSKKEERYLGIDIGAGGVKLVELLFENGKYQLMTYGYTQRSADAVDTPLTDNLPEAVRHLARLLRESGAVSRQVVASLPVHSVFSSILAIPKVHDEKQIRSLVERQASKLMPVALEEMVIDYQMMDEKKKEKKREVASDDGGAGEVARMRTAGLARENVRVLITGATKKMVKTYTAIFQDAGLDLVSLETEPFALIRSLVGTDKSPIMVLDIGSFRTNMTIVENGVPFLNRSIKVGGAMVTRKIAEQLSVDLVSAEQMKYDLAIAQLDDSIPKAVIDLFQPIVNEISYAMKLYSESEATDHRRIEKVILTGGSAHLPGLDKFLTEKLNVRTFVGDPWSRVQVNESMRPVLDDIGPRFAVAIGLAMHAKAKARETKPAKQKTKKKQKA